VSVRSVAEAAAALEGGADLIDVKEPSRGPLGRADDDMIAAVARFVDGRRPVSAALGELTVGQLLSRTDGLQFVKWGLGGWRGRREWRDILSARLVAQGGPRPVIVAYADWEDAVAPPVDEVAEFACGWPGTAFLLDTFGKRPVVPGSARPSLLTYLTAERVADLCRYLQDAGVRVAVAGSLDSECLATLRCARPQWFAVRGAACAQGQRDGPILASRVRELVNLLQETASGNSESGHAISHVRVP